MSDIMQPLSGDGVIPVGTLVWGTDFNAAVSQLYRWWGLLDAPAGTDTSGWDEGLFDDGFDAGTVTPSLDRSAHHLGYDDYRLHWIDGEHFLFHATYTEQQGDITKQIKLKTQMRKRGGNPLFSSIEARTETQAISAPFNPSYVTNRARATSTKFQAHMDALTGDATGMDGLLMPVLELHGLVASKADRSNATDEPLTDVDELRKSVSGTGGVADNVIRDFDGFAAWFATAPALFSFGLHKLERFEVAVLPNRRYRTLAQYDWRAETVNGAKIETHHPLTWILADTGEAYMRIEKLLPF